MLSKTEPKRIHDKKQMQQTFKATPHNAPICQPHGLTHSGRLRLISILKHKDTQNNLCTPHKTHSILNPVFLSSECRCLHSTNDLPCDHDRSFSTLQVYFLFLSFHHHSHTVKAATRRHTAATAVILLPHVSKAGAAKQLTVIIGIHPHHFEALCF